MRKLWIASIDDRFDPQEDILMGPWCFVGNEKYLKDYNRIKIIPDTFKTPEDLIYHEKLTSDFAISYMLKLTDLLNDINKSNYSERFWHALAFSWLIHLVQSTWEKQLRVNYLLGKYKNQNIQLTLLEKEVLIKFKDTKSFLRDGLSSRSFLHWICSRLLEDQLPVNWKVEWRKSGEIRTGREKKKKLRHELAHSFSRIVPFSRILGVGRVESIFWSSLMSFKKARKFNQALKQKNKGNLELLPIGTDWNELVIKTMPEYLKKLRFPSSVPRKLKKRIYFIGSFPMYDEKLKLKIAKRLEKGSEIITTQHGGHYGNAKVFSIAPHIEYNQYAFFSWGWREQEDYKGNIIDLPSPFLSKIKYNQKENTIIFVSMGAKPMPIRIYANPQPVQQIDHIYNRLEFLREIDIDIIQNMLYRPFFGTNNHFEDPASIIREEFPNLKILHGKLHDKLLKCKLLVLDHPGTTLNIALAANIPTICVWNPDAWPMCYQAEPYFRELEKAGIIYSSAEVAAKKVNEIWDDVKCWWNQAEIQEATKDWVRQYAKTSKHWRWVWIKEIWKL